MQQFNPQYKLSGETANIPVQMDGLQWFYELLATNGNNVHELQQQALQLNTLAAFKLAGIKLDEANALDVLAKRKRPGTSVEKKLVNYFALLKEIATSDKDFNVREKLAEWNQKLEFKTGEKIKGGSLRKEGNDKPSDQTDGYIAPEGNKVEGFYEQLLQYIESETEHHPLIKCWTSYYYFMNILPFEHNNSLTGRLLHHVLLKQNLFDYSFLPHLDKFLVKNNSALQGSVEGMLFTSHYTFRLEAELSQYLHIALKLHYNAVEEKRQQIVEHFKLRIKYQQLREEMKLAVDFLLENVDKNKKPLQKRLHERKKHIVYFLAAKGEAGTKELTYKMKCDRKTIQRDFNELLSLKLVKAIGEGSALKYQLFAGQ